MLRHGIFAVVYGALAVVVSLTLPLSVAGVDRVAGILSGAVVFTLGALLHLVWARMEERESVERRLSRLKEQQGEIRTLLLRLEERLAVLAAQPASPATSVTLQAPAPVLGGPLGGEVERVISDVRMLEALATRLPPAARRGSAGPGGEGGEVASGPSASASTSLAPALAPAPAAPPSPAAALVAAYTGRSAGPADTSQILEEVRAALRADRVDLFLQPVVSLPQRKHRFYEVFSRIRRDDGSHLMPEQYLPVAERAGLIAAIDNMLLFRCIQLLREAEKRHQAVGFFCNISAATLNDTAFMREFVTYMGQHPTLANRLVFELTQRDLMEGGVFATGFLDGLRRLGFRFSMDQVEVLDLDWEDLARHEIRHVKLDTTRLLDPEGPFADPRTVRDLKQQLDRTAIDLIAEKVESERQLLELLDMYIDFGQGYLFGEPRLARKAG